MLIAMLGILSCSKPGTEIVVWKPKQPHAGETVTVIFSHQRFVKADQSDLSLVMVCQLVQNEEIKTFKIPMTAEKRSWHASLKIEPGTFLLRLKFEDSMDRVEDNDGYGWNIIIRNAKNNLVRNAHHQLGIIFSQEKGSGIIPDYIAAQQEFKQELASFPGNYEAWFDSWNLALKTSNLQKYRIEQIQAQLDSLLNNSERNADLLALAFNTYWKILREPKSAVEYGDKLLDDFKDYSSREEIEYAMIFLKNGENPEALMNELIKFSQQTSNPEYQKIAYYQLAAVFQNFQMVDGAIQYFQKYIALDPNDIPIRLTLANLYLQKQDYDNAKQMIEQAKVTNTDENYFQSNPWEEPQQRREQVNLTDCQILSTRAALETALNNYPIAIQHRKQVIEQGTPFPAFEWVKIGDIYFQTGQLDSAGQAYVKAVSINSVQEDAIEKLRYIYHSKTRELTGFDNFLKDAITKELKASAKAAPDVALTDLNGDFYLLSEQKGKLVILTFWDSWSKACKQETPQLNALVEKFKKNQTVEFWAISVEAPVSINKFINENPFRFHLFHSGFEAKKLFRVFGFPTHFIIDSAGKIRYTHIGYSENIQNQLEQEILSILEEKQSIS